MTLVLSLITESWAIQVSDRRLVWLDKDGAVVRKDDERNKAVVWCNRLAFAYTGLAELGPMREATDAWLARELAESWAASGAAAESQDAVVGTIAAKATAAMERPRIARGIPPHLRRHAFVGIGWARFQDEAAMAPYIVQVHNFPQSQDAGAPATTEFGTAILRLPLGDRRIFVNWIGQELNAHEKQRLDALRDADPRSREFGPYAAGVLAGIVRSVAARNEYVGRGLLINSFPRWAIHPGQTETFLLAGGPMDKELTFLYVGPEQDTAVIRGPRYVCQGHQMANFEARALTDEDISAMSGHSPPSRRKARTTTDDSRQAQPTPRREHLRER